MMDRIYRGKSTEGGEWLIGYYQDEKAIRCDFPCIQPLKGTHTPMSWRVDPDTVGQFIGKADKNDKGIFEGDIVDIPGSKKLGLPAEIWFNQRTASFEIRRIGYNSLSVDGIEYWGEVVGNIHDNPELLEV